MKYLWDRIIQEGDLIGNLSLGARISKSYRIELSAGVRKIAALQGQHGPGPDIDFQPLADSFPPLTSKNLFVEFDVPNSNYQGTSTRRIGMHIVDWAIYSKEISSFQKLEPIDPARFAEVYAIVLYVDAPEGASFVPVGAKVGLDTSGHIELLDYFFVLPPTLMPPWEGIESIKRLAPRYIFLAFQAFSCVNLGELALLPLAQQQFIVKEAIGKT